MTGNRRGGAISSRPPPPRIGRLIWVLLAVGAALRLWQYLADASLWADEANMALNLVGRPLGALFGPLDHRQVAPPGWLLLEKSAVLLLGEGERALRLVPLVASLAALPLFAALAVRVLAGPAASAAVALFALGVPFVVYAAQCKPYSSDVAVTLGLWLSALDARRAGLSRARAARLALAGAAAALFSLPAGLVLAGLGLALAVPAVRARDWRETARLVPVLACWAGAVLASLVLARRGLAAADALYMRRFWAGAFWPLPAGSLVELAWPLARLNGIFAGGGLRYPAPGLFLGLAAVGGVALWRRRSDALGLLLAPVGATLAASAGGLYPFAPRVTLFLYPAGLLCVLAGVEALAAGRRTVLRAAAAACVALGLYALVRHPLPYRPEDLKPVLAAVAGTRQPGDRVYVYYGGEKAFRYYARRFGFRDGEYILGGCWRDDPRAYLGELDGLRGARRAWLVVTHALPELGEEALLLAYLDRIGTRQAEHRVPPPTREGRVSAAAGYLYDLSDPVRLAAATAAAFPVPARTGRPLGWSC